MQVLKVVAEGLVTSFRYPHFMQEIQPTFELPPPATIYGHICSVLGEWFDPKDVQFAYCFSYEKKFDDMEHTHLVSSSTGKIKDTDFPKVLSGAVVPFRRSLLFRPRMVLYLNRPDWIDAFRSPRYPVSLGRSQDLFTFTQIKVIDLQRANSAYFEGTLAPYSITQRTTRGVVVLMPSFLDYHNQRFPKFDRYVVLHHRVHTRDFLCFQDEELNFWIDPTASEIDGDQLGLIFHSWIGEKNVIAEMA